jgi:hypothetical protein
MKAIEKTSWPLYIGWAFSGMIGLAVAFPLCCLLSLPVMSAIGNQIGPMIWIRGEMRVTEDYLFLYTLFAFIPLYGVVVGLLQYLTLREKLANMGHWVLTTASGWLLAWLVIILCYSPLFPVEMFPSVGYSLAAGAALGALIGSMQWWLLRTQVPHAGWWIAINVLGFGIAGAMFGNMSSLPDIVVIFTIPHLGTSVVLWFLLEKFHRNVDNGISPGGHQL